MVSHHDKPYLCPAFLLTTKPFYMSLISVGSMAFDAIETPFGKVNQIVGGAGTYIAYAASNFVQPVSRYPLWL